MIIIVPSFETQNPWGISSAGRAPALHAGGQEFESPNLHHFKQIELLETEPLGLFFSISRHSFFCVLCIRDFEKKYRKFDI